MRNIGCYNQVLTRTNKYMLSTRELFLEYKVAKQYSEIWGRVEDNIHLVRSLEGKDRLPNQDDLGAVLVSTPGGASPSYWMQQVDVPGWFKYEELGKGGTINIWRTLATLGETNRRREKQRLRDEAALEAGLKVRHARRADAA